MEHATLFPWRLATGNSGGHPPTRPTVFYRTCISEGPYRGQHPWRRRSLPSPVAADALRDFSPTSSSLQRRRTPRTPSDMIV